MTGTPIGYLRHLAQRRLRARRAAYRRRSIALAKIGLVQAQGGQTKPNHPWRATARATP